MYFMPVRTEDHLKNKGRLYLICSDSSTCYQNKIPKNRNCQTCFIVKFFNHGLSYGSFYNGKQLDMNIKSSTLIFANENETLL